MRKTTRYLSENLLVSITLCFITGLILAREIRHSGGLPEFFPHILLVLIFLAFLFYFIKKNSQLLWLILLVTIGIGFQHGRQALQPPTPQTHIFNRITDKTEIVLVGTQMEMASFNGHNSRVLIQAKSIRVESSSKLLPTKGKVLLRFKGFWPKEYKAGDTLAIRCSVKRPDSYRTPGAFDYRQYLASQDIWITGFIKSEIFIHKLSEAQPVYHKLRFLPEKIRTRIGEQIDRSLQGDSAPIYRAILLGDRSAIDRETLESFKGSGTLHILAISGLHMAILGTLLFTALYWLLSRFEYLLLRFTIKKWAACICMPILIGYSLITGMNAPVTRAVIMSCIVILAIMTNRSKSPAPLVALAALILLLANPLQLYAVSFQLSFAAIISILFIFPTLKALLWTKPESGQADKSISRKFFNWLFAALLVSLVATLGSAPLLIFHFNRISTIGPLANLVLEPLICLWSLPAGFLSIPFTVLSPEISSFLLHIGSYAIHLAIAAANLFTSLPFSSMWLPTPPLWQIGLYYLALLLLALRGFGEIRWVASAGALLAVAITLMLCQDRIIKQRPETFQASFLDIGQGSSTFLEYPSGQRILVDGGGSSLGSQSVGEQIIGPYLWKKSIATIDAIVITHPDADHYNGLEYIVKHFSPKLMWIKDRHGHDENYKQLIELAKRYNVQVVIPTTGEQIIFPENAFKCVENFVPLNQQSLNNKSAPSNNQGLVLKALDRNFSILFPGDISASTEHQLVEGEYELHADILLSPHHGSKTSNTSEFLQTVAPRHLIVSAARYSRGRMPHPGLAQDCDLLNISLLSTATHGTLTVKSRKNEYAVFKTGQFNNNVFYPFEPVLMGRFSGNDIGEANATSQ